MSKEKNEEKEPIEEEVLKIKPIPHKRLQTATGWKTAQLRLHKPSKKAGKN